MILKLIALVFVTAVPAGEQEFIQKTIVEIVRSEGGDGLAVADVASRIYVRRESFGVPCGPELAISAGCTRPGTRNADGATVVLVQYSFVDAQGPGIRRVIAHELRHAVLLLMGDPRWAGAGHGGQQ